MKSHDRKIIYLAGFLYSIPIALASYINSSFLASFVGEKFVGLIYVLGSIVSILALLIIPKIFKKIGGYKFVLSVALLGIVSLFGMTLVKNGWSAIFVFILYFSFTALMGFSLDELLKIFSKDSATGKIRGIYMLVCNLAWVLAQLASGTILGAFSFKMIYLTGFAFMILFLLATAFSLNKMSDPDYDQAKTTRYVREFFKNRNLLRSYSISLLLQFFYCWMVVYTPIYLSAHLGFSWKEIGIIFAIMLLPFVLTPFPVGKYGDKFGERKILMFGFAIAGLATLSLFFVHQPSLWLWASLLFITRVGAACIDLMSDTYFFKHIRPENEEFVGVYRSAPPIAYILGPFFASALFIFLPFNFIYLFLGALMLFGIYLSSTIKKSDI